MIEWFKIEWLPLGTFFNVLCINCFNAELSIGPRHVADDSESKINPIEDNLIPSLIIGS